MKAIGTWKMSYSSFMNNKNINNLDVFLVNSIKYAESMENVHTIGDYSYPNDEGFLELDAAFMDGDNFMFGSCMGLRTYNHPIELAYNLSSYIHNNILVGEGTDRYRVEIGLDNIKPIVYNGPISNTNHDTCAMIASDDSSIKIAISSSGRRGKHLGRVGDSPLIGSGFYADSEFAGVAFTGDGEAIARGVLAKSVLDDYKITNDIQLSLERVCDNYLSRIKDHYDYVPDFCGIALDKDGNYAAYTSTSDFPFAIVDENDIKLMYSSRINGKIKIQEVDSSFLENYKGD